MLLLLLLEQLKLATAIYLHSTHRHEYWTTSLQCLVLKHSNILIVSHCHLQCIVSHIIHVLCLRIIVHGWEERIQIYLVTRSKRTIKSSKLVQQSFIIFLTGELCYGMTTVVTVCVRCSEHALVLFSWLCLCKQYRAPLPVFPVYLYLMNFEFSHLSGCSFVIF